MASSVTIDTREGHLGITCSDSDSCSGVQVDQVTPKDLLALAGLRAGMVITKLNGRSVSGHEKASKIWTRCQTKGEKLTIEYLTKEAAEARGHKETIRMVKCYGFVLALVLIIAASAVGWMYMNMPEKPAKSESAGAMANTAMGATGNMMEDMQAGLAASLGGQDKLDELRNMYKKSADAAKVASEASAAADHLG